MLLQAGRHIVRCQTLAVYVEEETGTMCVWCTATTIFLSSPHFLLKLSELVYLVRADMIKITSV